jgi:hypothetical protein
LSVTRGGAQGHPHGRPRQQNGRSSSGAGARGGRSPASAGNAPRWVVFDAAGRVGTARPPCIVWWWRRGQWWPEQRPAMRSAEVSHGEARGVELRGVLAHGSGGIRTSGARGNGRGTWQVSATARALGRSGAAADRARARDEPGYGELGDERKSRGERGVAHRGHRRSSGLEGGAVQARRRRSTAVPEVDDGGDLIGESSPAPAACTGRSGGGRRARWTGCGDGTEAVAAPATATRPWPRRQRWKRRRRRI